MLIPSWNQTVFLVIITADIVLSISVDNCNCGEQYRVVEPGEIAKLESPNYPRSNSCRSMYCIWYLYAMGSPVSVRFQSIKLQSGRDSLKFYCNEGVQTTADVSCPGSNCTAVVCDTSVFITLEYVAGPSSVQEGFSLMFYSQKYPPGPWKSTTPDVKETTTKFFSSTTTSSSTPVPTTLTTTATTTSQTLTPAICLARQISGCSNLLTENICCGNLSASADECATIDIRSGCMKQASGSAIQLTRGTTFFVESGEIVQGANSSIEVTSRNQEFANIKIEINALMDLARDSHLVFFMESNPEGSKQSIRFKGNFSLEGNCSIVLRGYGSILTFMSKLLVNGISELQFDTASFAQYFGEIQIESSTFFRNFLNNGTLDLEHGAWFYSWGPVAMNRSTFYMQGGSQLLNRGSITLGNGSSILMAVNSDLYNDGSIILQEGASLNLMPEVACNVNGFNVIPSGRNVTLNNGENFSNIRC